MQPTGRWKKIKNNKNNACACASETVFLQNTLQKWIATGAAAWKKILQSSNGILIH